MEEKSYSVSQVGNYIKQIIDSEELLHNIKVFGEISEFKISQGNAWFTLKDENGTLSCALFGAQYLEFVPKVGESVVIKGSPAYWVKSGKLAFVAKKIEHLGEGELYLKFLALKEKLFKEGLFDEARKKQVPTNAINIGVATSRTGAVMHDIVTVATRRNPAVNIFVAPCKVQGENADLSIIEALKILDAKNYDVIIIARGGGSKEDLDCFNSEKLARFIASMRTPTVSAVGHETDFTICDFVADKRAATPSAGAELVVANVSQYKDMVLLKSNQLKSIINKYLTILNDKIILNQKQLRNGIFNKINYEIQNISAKKIMLVNSKNHYFKNLEAKFSNILIALQKLNPLSVLSRGYAQIENSENKPIKSVASLKQNDLINVCFADGDAKTQVLDIKKREGKNGI